MNAERREELINRYLDGRASEAEAAELSHELETNEESRSRYVELARLHASLVVEGSSPFAEAQRSLPPQLRPVTAPKWYYWVRPLGVAAAIAVCAIIAGALWLARDGQPGDRPIVAEFGPLEECQWVRAGEATAQPGDSISAGRRLDLSSGLATVRFASGAVATLVGPCIFEVTSANGGFLTLGQMKVVAATPESKGFTVQTRTARVVDIGTEFVAAAAADGQSRVDVTSGEVQVMVDGAPTVYRLRTGEAFSVEPGMPKVLVRIESGTGTAAFQFPSIEPPSSLDYADASRGLARIRVAGGRLRSLAPVPSGPAEVLLDGRGQTVSDSPAESAFFDDNESGLLLLDLGQPITVSKINTYSWHQNKLIAGRVRAVQKFTLYGYSGDTPPPVDDAPAGHGWVQLARVNSDDFFRVSQPIDRPAQQACSITGAFGAIGRYRYLLWHAEPTQNLNRDHTNNTFYAEFDVHGEP